MSLEEKILRHLRALPEAKKAEVLDFVEYLKSRGEEREWADLSLSSATRGMEDEAVLYSLEDHKKKMTDKARRRTIAGNG